MSTNFTQQVKSAVYLHPSLLQDIYAKRSCNRLLFKQIIKRLLPYRTSIEIEHIGHLNEKEIEGKIDASKYPGYRGTLYNRSYSELNTKIIQDYFNVFHYEEDHDSIREYQSQRTNETKISILPNYKSLIGLYDILDNLKRNAKVDIDGSIHIHISISKWIDTVTPQKVIGFYTLLAYQVLGDNKLISKNIYDYCNNLLNHFLDRSVEIVDIDPNAAKKASEGNARRFGPLNGVVWKCVGRHFDRATYINQYIKEGRIAELLVGCAGEEYMRGNGSLTVPAGKLNWINLRSELKSIEYRSADCSFEYQDIIRWYIDLNALTRDFLHKVEQLGKIMINNYGHKPKNKIQGEVEVIG